MLFISVVVVTDLEKMQLGNLIEWADEFEQQVSAEDDTLNPHHRLHYRYER